MIKREIGRYILNLAKDYSVVTITGPRQSGKTTLVKELFPDKDYCNLEDLDIRLFAEQDPRGFLDQFKNGAILDEIQRVPSLLNYIQTIVDNDKRKSLFILTGSQQLELRQGINQSLAGRVALVTLLPLTISEVTSFKKTPLTMDEQLFKGLYPRIYDENLDPYISYKNYIQTYIERDLRQLISIRDLSNFQKFLKLCAGRIGCVLNKHSLSSEVGVSSTTIENWLSIMEASNIIFRLQPYFENFGKRIIKSPKLYFVDTGLACHLLDIENEKQVSRDPLRGNLIENLVFLELVKYRYNMSLEHNLYYFRDHHQNEVDFIFKSGNKLTVIEVKSAKTVQPEYFKGLGFFNRLVPQQFKKGVLIYSGRNMINFKGFSVLNYRESRKVLDNAN